MDYSLSPEELEIPSFDSIYTNMASGEDPSKDAAGEGLPLVLDEKTSKPSRRKSEPPAGRKQSRRFSIRGQTYQPPPARLVPIGNSEAWHKLARCIDENQDGIVDENELEKVTRIYENFKDAHDTDWTLNLSVLPEHVAEALRGLDMDNSGHLSVEELHYAADLYQRARKTNFWLRRVILLGMISFLLLLGAMFGLVWAVVELSKETTADSDGTLYVKGTHNVVRVGSVDTRVDGEILTTPGGAAIKTAQAPLMNATLTSLLPDEAFNELKVLSVTADNGAHLSLTVSGWVRIPSQMSLGGSYVKLITATGTIKIEGSTLSFDDLVGNIFEEAGFVVDGSGRKLLGLYELLGLFNAVTNWMNLDEGERAPGFDGDFYMEYIIRYPCDDDGHMCKTGLNDSYFDNYNDGAIEIQYTATRDVESGALLETMRNKEWPEDSLVTFKSPKERHTAQYNRGAYYYCQSTYSPPVQQVTTQQEEAGISGENSFTMDVRRAEKIGERPLDDGTVERHFELEVKVDKLAYAFLFDDMEATGWNGSIVISYYDDQANGYPRKLRYSNGMEMFVSKYIKTEQDLSGWALPSCESGENRRVDELIMAPYFPNFKRRNRLECDKDQYGECLAAPKPSVEDLDNYSNSTSRSLLGWDANFNAQNCGLCGSCKDSCCSCNCNPYTTSFGIDLVVTSVSIDLWNGGCGLASAEIEGRCGHPAVTCYGYCSGQTVLLKDGVNSLKCGAGIRFDLMDFVPQWIQDLFEFEFNVYLEMGFHTPDKIFFEVGARLGYIERAWYGSYGAEIGAYAGGNFYIQQKRLMFYFGVYGEACFVFCIKLQFTVASPSIQFRRRELLRLQQQLA